MGRVVAGVVGAGAGAGAPRLALLGEGVAVARALVRRSRPGEVRVSRNVFSHLEKNLDFVSEDAGWIVCAVRERDLCFVSLLCPW